MQHGRRTDGPAALLALATALLSTLLLAACAGGAALRAGPPSAASGGAAERTDLADLPAQVELTAVAFHPQDDDLCGPAALATAFSAAGRATPPQALVDQVFIPARQGALQAEMLGATRRAGLLPYPLPPALSAAFAQLADGLPVVVLQDVGPPWRTRWHYAVLVGYDRAADQVILRSGREARLRMGTAAFERGWRRADRWAFVALPPDRLPARPEPTAYLRAASELEAVHPAAAETAYRTALTRWPEHPAALLGLGNAAHAQGRLADAAAAFARATQAHPQDGDGWNNLAQTLFELNRHGEAEAAARRAVELGGPRRSTYAATLAAIQARGRPPGSRPGVD